MGFAIEYKEPDGHKFFPLKNRLAFTDVEGDVNPNRLSTRLSPIQKFRWIHFPRNAELPGEFVYRVTPVFMNEQDELSYGESQEAPSNSDARPIRADLMWPSPVALCHPKHS